MTDAHAFTPLNFAQAPVPMWIYAPAANAFRWANPAGLAFWGADDLDAFQAIDLSDTRAVTLGRLHKLSARLAHEPQVTETWTLYPGGTPRTVVCTLWQVDWDSEACLAIMALPQVDSETQADLRLRDRVLEAVAQSAERLLHGRDRVGERDRLLRELGEATGVDRAYAFEFHAPDHDTGDRQAGSWIASQVFEWCADGVRAEIDNPDLQNLDMGAHFPRWVARFLEGKPVVAAGPEHFPAAEWAILGPQGITALCVHPVIVDGQPVGFIGFDIVDRPERPAFAGWTAHLVDALATAAHMMAGAQRMAAAHRRLQEALFEAREASQAKSEFLANMSHELRTPLNAIIGFSDVLRNQLLGPLGTPRYAAYANDIHASGMHLLGLISDVLDHAKAESGAASLNEAQVALGPDIVEPSIRLVAGRAAKEQIEIEVAPDLPEVALTGDPRKLVQILTNLLSNAVKFSEAGSRVSVVWRLPGDGGVAVDVTDQGCGMSESDIALALQPFSQVGGASRRHHEGTGLGLPLARQLAELHGGRLTIASAPDAGTTATLEVPAHRLLQSAACARAQVPAARVAGVRARG